mgnify:FL=1
MGVKYEKYYGSLNPHVIQSECCIKKSRRYAGRRFVRYNTVGVWHQIVPMVRGFAIAPVWYNWNSIQKVPIVCGFATVPVQHNWNSIQKVLIVRGFSIMPVQHNWNSIQKVPIVCGFSIMPVQHNWNSIQKVLMVWGFATVPVQHNWNSISKSSASMRIRDYPGVMQLKFDMKKFYQYADSRLSRCNIIEIRYQKVLPVCEFAIMSVQHYWDSIPKSSTSMRIRDYVGAMLLKFDTKKFCQYANSRLCRCDTIETRYQKVLPVCEFAIMSVQYYWNSTSKSSASMRIRDYVGATLLKFDVKKFCQYANSRLAILLKFDSKKKSTCIWQGTVVNFFRKGEARQFKFMKVERRKVKQPKGVKKWGGCSSAAKSIN